MHEDVDYEPLPLAEAPTEALIETAWRAGQLAWKLDEHQLRVYEQYRAWEALDPDDQDGELVLVFVLDIARRWGKSFLVLLIKIEDALRRRASEHTFATAFAKDIGDILVPLLRLIAEDAPDDCRPQFRTTKQGESMGIYFSNGSKIKLVGIDKHPDGLRGRGSDGFAVTEAAHIKDLEQTMRTVVLPQFQRRPWARMILESSAPEDLEHDFDRVFVPDAKVRSAYAFGTIDDNEALDPKEKARFIRIAGGRDSERCRREYYGERVRSKTRLIVPEWNDQTMVRSIPVPEHALTFVAIDPGSRDLCGILWGYIHYIEALLVIQRAWAERNASTADIAHVLRETEEELWSDLSWYSSTRHELKPAPYLRTSDTNPRLLQDLSREHGIRVAPVKKSGGLGGLQTELREAGVNSYRTAVKRGQVVADPEAVEFIAHMNAGRWNEQRTDYERSERFGHFDLIDCGVIIHRTASPLISRDPHPPDYHHAVQETPDDVRHVALGHAKRREREESSGAKVIEALYGARGKKKKRDPIRRSKRTWRSR